MEEERADELVSEDGAVISEREQKCQAFASVAGCDQAVAQCYLAENDWELERAINSYFEPSVESLIQEGNPSGGTQEGNPSEESTSGGQQMPVTAPDCCIDLTSDEPVVTQNPDASKHTTVSQKDESHFIFVTWNIDGLDLSNLPERARAVCSYLALYSPDVVFLQEVIPPYYEYLKKRAVSYTIITGNEDGYFTAIMLKKSRAILVNQEIVPFPTTSMMRNLLVANVKLCGNDICLMTSHLESTKEHAKERLKQLGVVLQKILEVPSSTTVIFAGDTNLRDQEVEKIGGLPSPIMDIWEFLGKPEHCRYTWDTKMNNNLKVAYTCRLRFDRILYRSALDGGQVIPQSLDLLGTEKLDCGRFPSDHWGLLCDFDVIL
ncbi:PREDICTED: tyrosyl-DNA phosphodiesterase 2 [Nanorana parkeri]|uniref:tyrosyl-DNA phosphodiesterase 2 n=1 Tax=Nanorana parkeri TaxID=125878 RepID=UPI0008540D87|nr:PREDICTED: tyrosyl-DNA phosphodiesterase 2 [Nanorana parkeri]